MQVLINIFSFIGLSIGTGKLHVIVSSANQYFSTNLDLHTPDSASEIKNV